jgi:hypothetical protein
MTRTVLHQANDCGDHSQECVDRLANAPPFFQWIEMVVSGDEQRTPSAPGFQQYDLYSKRRLLLVLAQAASRKTSAELGGVFSLLLNRDL